MIQQTSLLAYSELRNNLAPRQAAVLDCIAVHGPINNKQIAGRLHWPINSVTGRVLELRNKKLVSLSYTGHDQSGRKQMYWELA